MTVDRLLDRPRDHTAGDGRADAPAATRYEALALLQVADVATTWLVLSVAEARSEGNPIVALFIERSGLATTMALLLTVKLAVVYVLWLRRTGVRFVSALYAAVVFNNALAFLIWLT